METIEYRDASNRLISASQVAKCDKYSELSKVDGYRRKELFFDKGELYQVEYYLDSNEIEAEIVNQYTSKVVCVFTMNQELNGYRRYEENVYSPEGVIVHREIIIYNSDDLIIYSASVDLINGSLFNITKFAYDQNGNLDYEFEYSDEGYFILCNIHKRKDINKNGGFKPEDIGVRADVSFIWEGYEYYQHAEPKIPHKIIS